jgi:hypothetical protein
MDFCMEYHRNGAVESTKQRLLRICNGELYKKMYDIAIMISAIHDVSCNKDANSLNRSSDACWLLQMDSPAVSGYTELVAFRFACRGREPNNWIILGKYNNSLTWIKPIWGWFPLLTMIPVRSQWGRYNLPKIMNLSKGNWRLQCATTVQSLNWDSDKASSSTRWAGSTPAWRICTLGLLQSMKIC